MFVKKKKNFNFLITRSKTRAWGRSWYRESLEECLVIIYVSLCLAWYPVATICTISQSWPSYYCWVSNTSVPVGQGLLPDGDRLLLLEGAPDQEQGWQDVFAKELQPTCPTSSWRCTPALGRRRSMGCWSRWRRGCPRDPLPGCAPTSSNCGTCGGQSYIHQMSQKKDKNSKLK